jgi:hypothetical protein
MTKATGRLCDHITTHDIRHIAAGGRADGKAPTKMNSVIV